MYKVTYESGKTEDIDAQGFRLVETGTVIFFQTSGVFVKYERYPGPSNLLRRNVLKIDSFEKPTTEAEKKENSQWGCAFIAALIIIILFIVVRL